MAIPKSIKELKDRMKEFGVSDEDLEKFQEELDEAEHDIASIEEDISDREQSLLLDFFRENLEAKEKVYDYVKAIFDGTQYKETTNDPATPVDNNNDHATPITEEKSEEKKMPDDPNNWPYQREQGNDGEGTVILNAGLMIIPDEVITNEKYLENIAGISYVLSYNNAMKTPPRLPYSYVEFWNEYVDEEQPGYSQIAEDIQHNEGPTYDYLMEHPPNDRILPVLEKVVDQLKYPSLDSSKNKRSIKTYQSDIKTFFAEQTPEYKLMDENLKKTCVLFKQNTNDTNFNTFELFINILDIYDRILYVNERNIMYPKQITDTKKSVGVKHHFARELDEKDCDALNETMVHFKDDKQSFFKRLKANPSKNEKINANVFGFQCIALSFILFIKAFMCETGNCLEKGYHVYKAPRSQRKKKTKEFMVNTESLVDIKKKKEKNEEKKENIEVDDGDIFFHNENMPLQVDLCIIAKDDNNGHRHYKDYGFEQKSNKNDFVIKSASFKTPTDRDSVYKLYGDFVKVFREVIKSNKLAEKKSAVPATKESKKAKKIDIRRDERYCIVMDEKVNKFYIYPPHFKNGNGKIIHKRSKNNLNTNNKIESKKTSKEKPSLKEEKSVENEDKIDNKFSLIPIEYNDITNFYLTSKCLIPSKKTGKYYGIEDINFVFSAHFHQQRQWHRHPKLRFYQYFNGGGLRFLHKPQEIEQYTCDKDLINVWPKYFVNGNKGINDKFISDCDIFDGVLDLYKCDAQYFQWDNAIKRQLININQEEKEKEERSTVINSICRALSRYYQCKNKPYDKLFRIYCQDNDIDDDVLEAEFEEVPADCNLIDFDDNFPCDMDGDKKKEFIFKTIKQCYKNPCVTFKVDIPQFNEQFFDINEQQLSETKKYYKSKCPKIYNSGIENDRAFTTLLAVGRKNNYSYVQHLVDDYFRAKVQNINNEGWNLNKWIGSHPHFVQLALLNYKVLNESTPHELARNAVHSFGKRCCPQLVFKPLFVINDDIETTIRYIESVTELIANVFNIADPDKTTRAICPFQIDLCLASGKPKQTKKAVRYNPNNSDDDDDDEVENKNDEWVDCIGNIKQKLKENNLQYKCKEVEPGRQQLQTFTKLFNELEDLEVNRNVRKSGWFYNLHQKRMVAFVDRRSSKDKKNGKDRIYMYKPPVNSSDIPSDACGLWYISASRTCLLPDMKYGSGENAEQSIETGTNESADKLKEANITSAFHCKAGLLTISCHVKSKDEVKMYLYFMGQIIRFMPKDITTLLPLLFNMDYGDNRSFIANHNEVYSIVNNIRKVIKDEYFQAFQYSYQR